MYIHLTNSKRILFKKNYNCEARKNLILRDLTKQF